jgi:hypothetical protein
MPYIDRNVVCQKCGKPFLFRAQEQEFFAKKSLPDPARCLICRAIPKAVVTEEQMKVAMDKQIGKIVMPKDNKGIPTVK